MEGVCQGQHNKIILEDTTTGRIKTSQEIIERLAWLFCDLGGGRDPMGYAIYRKAPQLEQY